MRARITTIIMAALSIAAIGGVTVATVLDRGYYKLRLLDEGLGQNALAEASMEMLRRDIELMLISSDLYVASDIQYLAPGVEQQISRLQEVIPGLNKFDVISREESRLRNVLSELGGVADAVAALGETEGSSTEVVRAYDQAAEALASAVLALSESVDLQLTDDSSKAVIAAEQHKWFQLFLLTVYLALMLVVLAVTLRWIAKPVRRLTVDARHAMELGGHFNPITTGPKEVRELGATILKFVSGLERTVAERTTELREQADELRKEIRTRRRTEAELRRAKREAEAASEAKSEFLSVISHELRTPMNAVLGTLTLLQDTKLKDEQRLYVRTARESGQALMSLLNDVLDLSAIEAGQLGLDSVDFHVSDTIEGVLDLFYPICADRGVVLAGSVSPKVPYRLQGDPHRIRQVLANLVGNAVKFTNTGHIYVSADSCLDAEGRASVRFTVSDTGCGISEKDLTAVFAKFTQLDRSHTRRKGGSGLGLAICRRLVDLMGGEIGVRSEVGEGSEFYFSLPIDRHAAPAVEDKSAASPVLGKVVIAGPPSEIKTALRKILSGWVEEVSSVETPRQLVEDCGSIADSPALIVALQQDSAAWNEWCAAVRFQTARFTTRLAVAPRLARHASGLVPTDLFDGVYGKVLSTRGVLEMLQGAESDVDSDGQIARLPARSGRILLVEDTAASRLVAKNILENVGYTVELAENGVEATSKIQHDKTYDLVLMDLQMPKMDGYEATRFIRKIREDLPIVALSADVTAAEQAKVRAVDFDDYLEKPLDRDILLCTVERRMSRPAYNSSSCPEKFLEPSEV